MPVRDVFGFHIVFMLFCNYSKVIDIFHTSQITFHLFLFAKKYPISIITSCSLLLEQILKSSIFASM